MENQPNGVESQEPGKTPAPFPEPFPEKTGFGPIDSDNRKEWQRARRKWEQEHGTPTD